MAFLLEGVLHCCECLLRLVLRFGRTALEEEFISVVNFVDKWLLISKL
jgi:hypothetical protein